MATSVGNAYIDLDVNTDKLNKSVDRAGKGMVGAFKKVGVIAAAAFGGAAVVAGIKTTITAASDLNESVSKTGVIFGKASADITKFAETTAQKFGISKVAALDAASTFATFGKAAGLTGKDLTGFSTQLVSLSSDLASFYNTSPEDAIQAIGAALRGESEPIRRYGVLINDATLKQEALRQGLIKTTKGALTPQQKVLAAQAVILKQTTDAQGDFARTADGAANQQRILAAQVENAKAKIGQGLLPIMTTALPLITKLMERLTPAIAEVATSIGNFVTNAIKSEEVQQFFSDLGTIARAAFEAVKTAVQVALPFMTAFAAAFGVIARAVAALASNAGVLRGVITGLIAAFAVSKVLAFSKAMQGAAVAGAASNFLTAASAIYKIGGAFGVARMAAIAFTASLGPIGLAAAAVGVVVGGVIALASGWGGRAKIATDSYTASVYAAQRAILSVRNTLSGAVSGILGYRQAVLDVANAETRQKDALAALQAARRSGNEAAIIQKTREYEQASIDLGNAKIQVSEAEKKQTAAMTKAGGEVQKWLTGLRTLQGEQRKQVQNIDQVIRGYRLLGMTEDQARKAVNKPLKDNWAAITAALRKTRDQLQGVGGKDAARARDAIDKALSAKPGTAAAEKAIAAVGDAFKRVPSQAATAKNKTNAQVGGIAKGVKTGMPEVYSEVQIFGDQIVEEARQTKEDANAHYRDIGRKSSPYVPGVIANNLAVVNQAVKSGGAKIVGESLVITRKANAAMRKLFNDDTGASALAIQSRIFKVNDELAKAGRLSGPEKTVAQARTLMRKVIDTLQREVESRKARLASAMEKISDTISKIAGPALAAFDRLTSKEVDRRNKAYDELTESEKTLADMQEGRAKTARDTAVTDANAAVVKAQAELDAAMAPGSGAWQEDIDAANANLLAAKQQQADALYAIEEYNQQKLAEKDRRDKEDARQRDLEAYNLERENMRNAFEANLVMLQEKLKAGQLTNQEFVNQVNGSLATLGVNATNISETMGSVISTQFSAAMQSLVSDATAAAEAVQAVLEIDGKNGLTAAIKKAKALLNKIGKKKNGKTVKAFADGGVVTSPTLALIGETSRARPEIVTPERLMRQIIREEGGAGGGATEVRVYIGDQELRGMVRSEVVAVDNETTRKVYAGVR